MKLKRRRATTESAQERPPTPVKVGTGDNILRRRQALCDPHGVSHLHSKLVLVKFDKRARKRCRKGSRGRARRSGQVKQCQPSSLSHLVRLVALHLSGTITSPTRRHSQLITDPLNYKGFGPVHGRYKVDQFTYPSMASRSVCSSLLHPLCTISVPVSEWDSQRRCYLQATSMSLSSCHCLVPLITVQDVSRNVQVLPLRGAQTHIIIFAWSCHPPSCVFPTIRVPDHTCFTEQFTEASRSELLDTEKQSLKVGQLG